MPRTSTLIPFADYSRIYQVLYSALEAAEAKTHSACIFFSVVGGVILRENYGVQAELVAGAAAYAFDAAGKALFAYGKEQDGDFVSAPDGFHAWIECDGYVVDFMAPIFGEQLRLSGECTTVPRRMFQKPLSAAADHFPEPTEFGAFLLVPDAERTSWVKSAFAASEANSDLGSIAMSWFKRPPKSMKPEIQFHDTHLGPRTMRLRAPSIDGTW